jgi:heme oxygenase
MTLLAPAALDQPLSTAMREGSRAEHQAAEGSAFMTALLAGEIGATGYTAYLLRLRVVYDALESTARAHLHDPVVAAVHDPALERLAALDADLDVWAPGAERTVDSPAATAYADRVLSTITDGRIDGGRFAAHHYTRYLGDLSGGQAIGRILDRAFDLGGRGVAFYAFDTVGKPKPYKDGYRARLDALALSGEAKEAVVDEVRAAFALNQALFTELGGQLASHRR